MNAKKFFPDLEEEMLNKERVKSEQADHLVRRIPKDEDIPTSPKAFYESIGLLEHPMTRKPVGELTSYQINRWREAKDHKYRLIIKSQKVGITTTSLMEDFQRAILPISNPMSCRGREILLIAQKYEMAKEHLNTLYNMVVNSEMYRDFLIEKPVELKTRRGKERSKANMLYIYNPDNPAKPTRIIALGPRASGVWSWKNVKHIHMSDVAAVDQVDDSQLFGAAFSRLANTNGSILIETPPRGQRGKVWEIYQQSELTGDDEYEGAKFLVRRIPAEMAVQAGLITQEFLDSEKIRLGPLYGMFYECDFINPYTTWYTPELFEYDNNPDYVSM